MENRSNRTFEQKFDCPEFKEFFEALDAALEAAERLEKAREAAVNTSNKIVAEDGRVVKTASELLAVGAVQPLETAAGTLRIMSAKDAEKERRVENARFMHAACDLLSRFGGDIVGRLKRAKHLITE